MTYSHVLEYSLKLEEKRIRDRNQVVKTLRTQLCQGKKFWDCFHTGEQDEKEVK